MSEMTPSPLLAPFVIVCLMSLAGWEDLHGAADNERSERARSEPSFFTCALQRVNQG